MIYELDQHIVLPFPPSANRYWRNWQGRMVKSQEARDYQALIKQTCKAFSYGNQEVSLDILFYRFNKSRNLDNCLKVMIDALEGICYDNDKQVKGLYTDIFDDKKNPRADIIISVYSKRERISFK